MQIKSRVIFLSLILALAMTLLRPYRASAATIEVNMFTDAYDENQKVFCTLRMAVVAANENRSVGACAAGSSVDMDLIILSSSSSYKYQLDLNEEIGASDSARSGDLDITGSLTISGFSAESTTIQGTLLDDRIFHIKTTGVVVLRNLTIKNGKALTGLYKGVGGGILNEQGNLTVDGCMITGNDGSKAGGGISNKLGATVLVTGSTIQSNTSDSGAGIHNNGYVTVRNSLIYDNRAKSTGGGFVNNLDSTAVLFNVTISTNQGDTGSGIFSQSTITITNSTIADNIKNPTGSGQGAGIVIAPNTKALIANSIIARHEFNCGSPTGNNPSYFISRGGNLEDKNTCLFNATRDQHDIADPGMNLGLVLDLGGQTKYYSLIEGSIAIGGAIQDFCPAYDQRGIFFGRKDGACDIGSFEFGAVEEKINVFLPTVRR